MSSLLAHRHISGSEICWWREVRMMEAIMSLLLFTVWIFGIYITWRILKAFELIASSFADIANTMRRQQQK